MAQEAFMACLFPVDIKVMIPQQIPDAFVRLGVIMHKDFKRPLASNDQQERCICPDQSYYRAALNLSHERSSIPSIRK